MLTDFGGKDEEEDTGDEEAQRAAAEEFLQLAAADNTPLTRIVTSAQLRALLAHLNSDEAYYRSSRYSGNSREPDYPFLPRFDHPVPNPEGTRLMQSGVFGSVGSPISRAFTEAYAD